MIHRKLLKGEREALSPFERVPRGRGYTVWLHSCNLHYYCSWCLSCDFLPLYPSQDPHGIFELIEVVGNGTYGQVHKVRWYCVFTSVGSLGNLQIDHQYLYWGGE